MAERKTMRGKKPGGNVADLDEQSEPKEEKKLLKVAFSSDEKRFGLPPESVRIGLRTLDLPDAESQLKGFDLDEREARALISNVPGYKLVKSRGGK